MKTDLLKRHPYLMVKWTCSVSFHVPLSGRLTVNAYLKHGCVNWCGRSCIFHVQLPTHFLQVHFATSQGLRVPSEIIPSSLSVGARSTPFTEVQRFMGVGWNSTSVTISREIRIWGVIYHFTTGMLVQLNPRHLTFVLHPMETQRRSTRSIRSNTNLSICFVSCFIASATYSIDKPLRIQAKLASSCLTVASRGPLSKEICKRRDT